jgi:hypothetical protein
MSTAMTAASTRPLRRGDLIEVRSPAEILATLDADGTLDGVPFMPEMLKHAGRRFTVSTRVEKFCDTIAATGSRRMRNTVYLEDLRCDGSGHGGCQAGCLIYWKEAWVRRVDGPSENDVAREEGRHRLEELSHAGAQTVREFEDGGRDVWRCQATEAFRASEPLKTSDVRQYWRELRCGNIRLPRFLLVATRGFVMEVAARLRLLRPTPLRGAGAEIAAPEVLDLQPGDLVQVRSAAEIAPTLDADGLSRRLSFDREMLPFCGRTYRVKDRVERLIDDRTGRMLKISADCLILEGVVCSGERSVGRWFCPRQIYPYWREAWLRRADESPETASTKAANPDPSPTESGSN